jgi:putative ABC transport system permease protein
MPEAFAFPERSSIWTPLALSDSTLQDFGDHYLRVFARLRPGISVQAGSRELKQLTAQLTVEHPREDTNVSAFAIPLRDQLVGNLRLGLLVLCAGVCCVLLIACANVAGLLLARGFEQKRELAVRAALGATRLHLLKKALLESLILSFAGGALGLLSSTWVLPFIKRLVPLALAGWARPHLDWRLTLFTFAVSTVSALAFGVLPAAKASRLALEDSLRQQSRTVAGVGNRTRRFLVIGEVTLATALVCGAGLFLRTFWALSHVPLGFRSANLLTLRTNLPYAKFSTRISFYQQVLQRVETIPGVKSAGYTTFLPLTNGGGTTAFTVEGHPPPPPGQANDANLRVVSDHYLQTMRVRLRSGRFFAGFDGSEARPVAIINSAMARQYWPGENALDHRVALEKNGPWIYDRRNCRSSAADRNRSRRTGRNVPAGFTGTCCSQLFLSA